MENTERLLGLQAAANYLNAIEEPAEIVATIKNLLPVVKSGARLTGDLSVINPLLDSYAANPVEFRSVIRMIIQARSDRDWSTREYKGLLSGETPAEREKWSTVSINLKKDFTRKYVKNTRDRLNRALDLHNNKLAYNDRIKGKARLDWLTEQWKKWSEEREKYVRKGNDGRMSRAEIALKTAEFWEMIDDQMDEKEGK